VGLILLNFVLWVVQGGLLAWETHLGGFVAGWICGQWLAPGPGASMPPKAPEELQT
jgi:membrane associated rhomboid family serine protease